MVVRLLFFVGCLLLLLALLSLVGRSFLFQDSMVAALRGEALVPPTTPTPPNHAPPFPTPLPTLEIKADWRRRMHVGQSDSIRVSLVTTGQILAIPTGVGGQSGVSTPVPFATPGVPAGGPAGPEYEAVAVARLVGTAFDIQPVVDEAQSLQQPSITWEWSLFPKSSGRQIVYVTVVGQWQPKGGGPTLKRQLWDSRLEIQVTEPLFALGQLNLLTLLSGFLGSALSVPWIFQRFQELRGGSEEAE